MGNFQTGTKDEGVLREIVCEDCNKEFEAIVNKITIKGPTPDPTRCDECQAVWTIAMHDNVRHAFGNLNHTDNSKVDEPPHINETNMASTSEPRIEKSDTPQQYEVTLHYAKWCHYSKDMLPEWKIFEDYASKHFKDLKVTRICYERNEQPNNSIVQAIPTIILTLTDGTFVKFDYDRNRRVEFFIQFVRENIPQ
jgi:hypothetical protein